MLVCVALTGASTGRRRPSYAQYGLVRLWVCSSSGSSILFHASSRRCKKAVSRSYPSAGHPVFASVPLGGAFGSFTGTVGPFWTPYAPHTWHVSARHMHSDQLRSLLSLYQPKGAHRTCFSPDWQTIPSSSRKP
jgi:hypothetical protein